MYKQSIIPRNKSYQINWYMNIVLDVSTLILQGNYPLSERGDGASWSACSCRQGP